MIPEQWCSSLFVPINPSNETALSVSEVFVFLRLNFPALKDNDAEPLKPTTLGSDLMVQCLQSPCVWFSATISTTSCDYLQGALTSSFHLVVYLHTCDIQILQVNESQS